MQKNAQISGNKVISWTNLRSQPTVSALISSARTVAQLEEIVQVIHLSADEVEKLNTLSAYLLLLPDE